MIGTLTSIHKPSQRRKQPNRRRLLIANQPPNPTLTRELGPLSRHGRFTRNRRHN